MDSQPPTLSLLLWVHRISSDFKNNHSVLPSFATCKLDLLGSGDVVERVFESVSAAALPWKEDCCCNSGQWNQQHDQRNEKWGIRKKRIFKVHLITFNVCACFVIVALSL